LKLELGTTVDRYTVDAVIGAGGTAMVYRVTHNALGTLHALKVLTISSDSIRKRMLQEGQVQAALQHLNVVSVTDVLDISGNPGLLMEYIEGPSLERALGKFRIRMGDAETLFLGIVSGVRQAHRMGVVHRDLKPANVLLDRSSEGYVPKVTDFGLVKSLAQDPNMQATRSGIAMGTPSYMAPEQIRDARSVDQRADIWSLGCILYELMTRRRAFPGEETLAIYNAVTDGDYPPVEQWVDGVPDRILSAITGCLMVDPANRIPNCEVLLEVLSGERSWTVTSRGPSTQETEELPRVLPEDVPSLEVAHRGPEGQTPGPAPSRGRLPPHVVSPVESLVEDGPADDGTLQPVDSMAALPRTDAAWAAILVFLLAGGVSALLLLVGIVVFGTSIVDKGPNITASDTPSLPSSVLTGEDEEAGNESGADAVDPAVEGQEETDEGESDEADDEPAAVTPAPSAPANEAASPPPVPVRSGAPRPVLVRPKPTPAPASPPEPEPEEETSSVEVDPTAPTPVKLLSVPPTAQVLVSGRPRGLTPLPLSLSPGKYPVQLISGDRTVDYVIEVTAGGDNKWCYDFANSLNRPGGC